MVYYRQERPICAEFSGLSWLMLCSSIAGYLDYNLAEMITGLRVIVGLLQLIELEGPVDDGSELGLLKGGVQLLHLLSIACTNTP